MDNHNITISVRTDINSFPKWNNSMTGSLRFRQRNIIVFIDGQTINPADNLVPEWEERDEHGYLTDHGEGIEAGSPHGQLLMQLFPNCFEVVSRSTYPEELDPYDGVPADTGSV